MLLKAWLQTSDSRLQICLVRVGGEQGEASKLALSEEEEAGGMATRQKNILLLLPFLPPFLSFISILDSYFTKKVLHSTVTHSFLVLHYYFASS